MNSLLLWIHIVAGILWIGGLFFIIWGVYPAIRVLPVLRQKRFLPADMIVILTGFFKGISGPVNEWDMLLSSFTENSGLHHSSLGYVL